MPSCGRLEAGNDVVDSGPNNRIVEVADITEFDVLALQLCLGDFGIH
jgi:hypothetical protein